MSLIFRPSAADVQPQWLEELKQQKHYMKLLKKQSKELKELRKKHLKKVKERERERKQRILGGKKIKGVCFQVWNLSKEQKSRKSQIQSDSQRRRSQIEKNLKRSIKKK